MSSNHENEGNGSNEEPLDKSPPFESYKDPVKAMLAIATFAASITYTTILTPRDQQTPSIAELAYANSLFFGAIMGCVLIIVSIEMNCILIKIEGKMKKFEDSGEVLKAPPFLLKRIRKIGNHKWVKPFLHDWLIPLEVWVVAMTLFAAFFLMLHAGSLFLRYNGPFIVGSVLYLGLGAVAFILWFLLLYLNAMVSEDKWIESKAKATKSEEKIEKSAEKIEVSEV